MGLRPIRCRPMYAGANMGHPSREGASFFARTTVAAADLVSGREKPCASCLIFFGSAKVSSEGGRLVEHAHGCRAIARSTISPIICV
jgi:hypothetical protein